MTKGTGKGDQISLSVYACVAISRKHASFMKNTGIAIFQDGALKLMRGVDRITSFLDISLGLKEGNGYPSPK